MFPIFIDVHRQITMQGPFESPTSCRCVKCQGKRGQKKHPAWGSFCFYESALDVVDISCNPKTQRVYVLKDGGYVYDLVLERQYFIEYLDSIKANKEKFKKHLLNLYFFMVVNAVPIKRKKESKRQMLTQFAIKNVCMYTHFLTTFKLRNAHCI